MRLHRKIHALDSRIEQLSKKRRPMFYLSVLLSTIIFGFFVGGLIKAVKVSRLNYIQTKAREDHEARIKGIQDKYGVYIELEKVDNTP